LWNLKKWYELTYLQNQSKLTDIENNLMVTQVGEGKDKLGILDLQIHTTLYKTDKQQGPTV